MQTNFKNIYFTALDKEREIGNVVSNQDVKDCLDYAVNQEFWNMSESFQASLSGMLFKEYRRYCDAKEQLKEKRLKSLEKARLVKALKKAQAVKSEEKTEISDTLQFAEEPEEKIELLKEIDFAIKTIEEKQKRLKKSLVKDGINHDELVTVNGKTYRLTEV